MSEIRFVDVSSTHFLASSNILYHLVKCFGTEGRPTDRPTPPKDDIYEYITFRGSDIKDITLCELPRSHHGLPPDPAIVQVTRPTCLTLHMKKNLNADKVNDDSDSMCYTISIFYSVL